MAYITQDGSITDRAGKVIFFSAQRFVDDICLGNCCFICGAKPEDKPFDNERILSEWLLRLACSPMGPRNRGEPLHFGNALTGSSPARRRSLGGGLINGRFRR